MNYVLFVFAFCVFQLNAQVYDDFSNEFWNRDPFWIGDTSKFSIVNGQLVSNSVVGNDQFSITTKGSLDSTAEWRIKVMLKFPTSSKNYIDFVLLSDSGTTENSNYSMFLSIGGLKDNISLWQRRFGVSSILVESTAKMFPNSTTELELRVVFKDSLFQVYTKVAPSRLYDSILTVRVPIEYGEWYTGISVTQSSSTFFRKHFFDDFYFGPMIKDTIPPKILEVYQEGFDKVFVKSSEKLFGVEKLGYVMSGISIDSVVQVEPCLIQFSLKEAMVNEKYYSLELKGLQDKSGNSLDTTLLFESLIAFSPSFLELIITEILPSPEPVVALPLGEFVEVYNRSDRPLEIGGMTICDRSRCKELPSYTLRPDSYLILCDTLHFEQYRKYGKVIGLVGFTLLNAEEDLITLNSEGGEVVHQLSYSTYAFPEEKRSGWSLEMIDVSIPCVFKSNWKLALDASGGSPGRSNSVQAKNEDGIAPRLIRVAPIHSNALVIHFSEPIWKQEASVLSRYTFLKEGIDVDSIEPNQTMMSYSIYLDDVLDSFKRYMLVTEDIEDCAGNVLVKDTILFGLAQSPKIGDVLINEIMFDPLDGKSEYLELYNNSNKFFDLSRLKIAKGLIGSYSDVYYIQEEPFLFPPKTFVVLKHSRQDVGKQFLEADSTVYAGVDGFSLPKDSRISVLNAVNVVLDTISYTSNWHFELLSNSKGVSLERIDIRERNEAYNWTSASQTSGFGTPGLPNSQAYLEPLNSSNVELKRKYFSPNGDGVEDLLNIEYSMDSENYIALVYIFTEEGRLVKKILNPGSLSIKGSLYWNGDTEEGGIAKPGIYILMFEYYNDKGEIGRIKIAFALTSTY